MSSKRWIDKRLLCVGLVVVVALSTWAAAGGTATRPVGPPPRTAAGSGPESTLVKQLALARLATAKYASDLQRAQADGYGIITKMIPNMGYHYMNPTVKGFDVRKPPILVYEHRGSAACARGGTVGFM